MKLIAALLALTLSGCAGLAASSAILAGMTQPRVAPSASSYYYAPAPDPGSRSLWVGPPAVTAFNLAGPGNPPFIWYQSR